MKARPGLAIVDDYGIITEFALYEQMVHFFVKLFLVCRIMSYSSHLFFVGICKSLNVIRLNERKCNQNVISAHNRKLMRHDFE